MPLRTALGVTPQRAASSLTVYRLTRSWPGSNRPWLVAWSQRALRLRGPWTFVSGGARLGHGDAYTPSPAVELNSTVANPPRLRGPSTRARVDSPSPVTLTGLSQG